jgi:hypothetical protein
LIRTVQEFFSPHLEVLFFNGNILNEEKEKEIILEAKKQKRLNRTQCKESL